MYWLDVEDANGVKLGDGPILSATDWTHTTNLDRAGSFTFTMPRDDPRAALLHVKRRVRCWGYADGTLQHLGTGIINDIQTSVTPDGAPMLTVSGDTLLAELLNRIIRFESFLDQVWVHPSRVLIGSVTKGRMFDYDIGDTSTWADFTASSLDSLYIYSPVPFDAIKFTLGSVQTNNDHGHMYYTTSDGWCSEDTANALVGHLHNGTIASGTAWFSQSGILSWDMADLSDWAIPVVGGTLKANYGVYLLPPYNGWTTFGIHDVAIRVMQPIDDALARIMAYAPEGWGFDAAHGYTATQQREMGPEMLVNGGFEDYTGTPDDATSDTITGWRNYANDGAGNSARIVTSTKHSGATAVLITHGVGSSPGILAQDVDVEPNTEYTISYWTRTGANNGQVALALHAVPAQETIYIQDSTVTTTDWTQVVYSFATPVATTRLAIYFFTPTVDNASAYLDDVSMRRGGGRAIALDAQGETVLENIVRVHETTGEHFIESPSPNMVLLLGHDVRDSGLRAVAYSDAVAVAGHDDIALIQSLAEAATGVDLISRVYAYGGAGVTLAQTTRPMPDGYTLDRTNNCLIRTQSEAAYGRIERRLDASDITNLSGGPDGLVHASNMLFDRALLYLMRHSATNTALDGGDLPRTYNLQLLKCTRQLLPGYTLRLQYDRYRADNRSMHIDGDYWITSATRRADATGVHTVAVTCSTVDMSPPDEHSLLVGLLRTVKGMRAHG